MLAKIVSILRKSRRKQTTGALARSLNKMVVPVGSSLATCWCAVGLLKLTLPADEFDNIPTGVVNRIMTLNDNEGLSFRQIATRIEKEYLQPVGN